MQPDELRDQLGCWNSHALIFTFSELLDISRAFARSGMDIDRSQMLIDSPLL